MAGRTERFGFSTVGGISGGSLADDGQKYTSSDRVLLDETLARVEGHDHIWRASAADLVVDEPVLSLVAGGFLEPGSEVAYRVALVDADGRESAAGDEAIIQIPDQLEPPDELAVDERDGVTPAPGALLPGLYTYGLSAVEGVQESQLGVTIPVRVEAGQSSVLFVLPEYLEASSFRVWRRLSTDTFWTLAGEVLVSAGEFLDVGGQVADPLVQPSLEGATGFVGYSVEVALPVSAVGFSSWKIYRSYAPGYYPASSLVEHVTAFVDENDPLQGVVSSWIDDGDAAELGSPVEGFPPISFEPFRFEVLGELGDVLGRPEGYPALFEGKLYVVSGGEWVLVSAGGSGGGVGPVFTSPNGSRFVQGVDDSGAVTMTPTVFPGPPAPVVLD